MVDCRHILNEIPHDLTHRMMSPAHELAAIERVVHQPRLVAVGLLEHPHPQEDIVGWLSMVRRMLSVVLLRLTARRRHSLK